MPEPWVAPEYVEARRALLDALGLLVDQLDALVLVGAQAVYLHAPASIAQRPTSTTLPGPCYLHGRGICAPARALQNDVVAQTTPLRTRILP